METFNNVWIYAPDTANVVPAMALLPHSWRDPDTGKSYSTMRNMTEAKLNAIHWYKVMEIHGDPPNKYQKEQIQSFVFRAVDSKFVATFVNVYRSLATVRAIKSSELTTELRELIETNLDNVDDTIKWVMCYKAIAKIIAATSPLVPAIANDAFLQGLLTKATALNTKQATVKQKILDISTMTDIETIIAAK